MTNPLIISYMLLTKLLELHITSLHHLLRYSFYIFATHIYCMSLSGVDRKLLYIIGIWL